MRLHLLCLILLSSAIVGCNSGDTKPENAPNEQGKTSSKAPAAGGPVDSDPHIIAPAAGGASPVVGGDNLGGGGGGGVGNAAKDRARDVANKAGGSSLDQLGGE